MKIRLVLTLAFAGIAGLGSDAALACGDKFLLVGRGVTFQRAYAAIHRASILIVLPPKSVKAAAVRDSSLLTALKMAGHRVDVAQAPVNLVEALDRSRRDIVIAEQDDVAGIRLVVAGSAARARPSIVSVVEKSGPAAVPATAPSSNEFTLKAPQSLPQILNMLDDIMKARIEAARRTPAPGA